MTAATQPPSHCDIAIIGGGPVGLFLAHTLRHSNHQVVVLEAEPDRVRDDPRMLALSVGSQQLLEQNGCWSTTLAQSPIRHVHVSQQGFFGHARLKASDMDAEQLGHVVPYPALQTVLTRSLPDNTTMLAGARVEQAHSNAGYASVEYLWQGHTRHLTSRLLVLADGGSLLQQLQVPCTERDYQQCALVGLLEAEQAPADTTFERFVPGGALALLPQPGGYAVIWSQPLNRLQDMQQTAEATLCLELQRLAGHKAGQFRQLQRRHVMPLKLRYARQLIGQRFVLIGNAAQSLHPIAGQGLNLGLRDAWELTRLLAPLPPQQLDHARVLADYPARRRLDKLNGVGFTDSLIRLFAQPGLGHVRGAGLSALNLLPGVKRRLLQHLALGVRRA